MVAEAICSLTFENPPVVVSVGFLQIEMTLELQLVLKILKSLHFGVAVDCVLSERTHLHVHLLKTLQHQLVDVLISEVVLEPVVYELILSSDICLLFGVEVVFYRHYIDYKCNKNIILIDMNVNI